MILGDSKRLIGLQHKTPSSRKFEGCPTTLFIKAQNYCEILKLEDSLAELDWVHFKFPIKWKRVELDQNLKGLQKHHIRFRDPYAHETLEYVTKYWPLESLNIEIKNKGKVTETRRLLGMPYEFASAFAGMLKGDIILTTFGNYGLSLNTALIIKASEIGGRLFMVSSHLLEFARRKERCGQAESPRILVDMFEKNSSVFHEMHIEDTATWQVMHNFKVFDDAMRQRIAMVQRSELPARFGIFSSNKYPGSSYDSLLKEAMMREKTIKLIRKQELEEKKRLIECMSEHPLYKRLSIDMVTEFPDFFGRLLSGVIDIRRFNRSGIGAFLLFCGYGVQMVDGRHTIQRNRKSGENPGRTDIKSAVWNLVETQFARQKSGRWAERFREIKKQMSEKYPHTWFVCDTEIQITDKNCKFIGNSAVVSFSKNRSHTFTTFQRVKREDGEYLIVPPEIIILSNDQFKIVSNVCEFCIDGVTKDYRSGITRNSRIHIHKKAKWRVGTEFLVWIFHEWWTYVESKESDRAYFKKEGKV